MKDAITLGAFIKELESILNKYGNIPVFVANDKGFYIMNKDNRPFVITIKNKEKEELNAVCIQFENF